MPEVGKSLVLCTVRISAPTEKLLVKLDDGPLSGPVKRFSVIFLSMVRLPLMYHVPPTLTFKLPAGTLCPLAFLILRLPS